MQCAQCGQDNPAGQKFCGECGARLEARCAACGTVNPPGQKFCGECGGRLGAAPAASPPPTAYTPAHLAERILTSRAAIEGERKQVTVLFADLKGSLELLADRDPEDARRLQDPVLERMMEAVQRYEGTVNQVMGDGIMALFGAPLAHEDHALRACYAALRLQETLAAHAESVRRSTGIPVLVRVGLNSGEVVVRSIGSDLKMDYSAVGQTVSLAARMEQMAAPGSILLTPATLGLVEGSVQVRALGPLPVKGLAAPLEVYELTGAALGRTRFQAAAARGLTRFVGRDAELATLRRTLAQAGEGHGQVVALVGEPGVGKSRLVWEFAHSHRAQGWLVLETRSVSYGKATSYLPVLDLLKGWCGIETRDTPRRMREKLTGKLLTLDSALQPTLPALLQLLDLPVDDPAWAALDPPQRRQRTLDALKRLLLREAQEQPLLLVFEDLHWLDAETQALLDSLVESLPAARLLLLVNYRPEYTHAWASKTYYQQLRLDPLPAASADALLDALLGDDDSLAPLKPLLIARTEGNPFFLEESVRALVETGVLAGEPGSYRLAQPVERTRVPATVQAVLAARIDRLAPVDKRVLQAAAVIGKDVPYPLLQAIAELPEERLRASLATLQATEFLYEASLFPDLEYTFKHALTHEVAYGSLLGERRRTLHAQIVTAIERLYPDRLAEQVERLADHALRGEVWEKAVAYCRQAANKADARSALREAVAYFDQALGAVAHLPDTHDARVRAFDLRLDLHAPLMTLGEFDRMLVDLTAARVVAENLDDSQRLGRVLTLLATMLSRQGEYGRAIAYGEQALSIADELDDSELRMRTYFNALGQTYHSLGNYDQAVSFLRRSLDCIPEDMRGARYGLVAPAFLGAAHYLIWSLAEQGEFEEAAALAAEVQRVGENTGRTIDSAWGDLSNGYLLLLRGDPAAAASALKRGLVLCEAASVMNLLPRFSSGLGYAYVLAGRVPEGLLLLERGVQQAGAELVRLRALRLAWLSEGYLIANRVSDARDKAEYGLVVARTHHERASEAVALRVLGEIAAEAEPPDVEQTELHYRQAFALAEELGMRPLQAHCHLGLGRLYARVGRQAEARAALGTAAEMYRAMEMTYWLGQAEAALTQGNA